MKLIKKILKEGKIKSMSGETGVGSTGEAHLAILEGKKYLLRICSDNKTSRKYLAYYHKFKKYGFLPKLLEINGKYMLFEFIEGKMCDEEETSKTIYKVGRICAIINKFPAEKDYKIKKNFLEKLKEIKTKKIISKELAEKVKKEYNLLKKRVDLKYSLDAGDVTCDNFMVDTNGKVYFVDIEAIKSNIKGMGIAKAFSTWFKKEDEQKKFRKGYNSINSIKFYDKNYAKLVTLIFFINRIRFKAQKGEQDYVKRTINKLERLLETK